MSALALLTLSALSLFPNDLGVADRDGDGLSDFHEVHKYRTDPAAADTDGDGIADGDWHERREYTYTVRSIVQVLGPTTPANLSDDFQDARLLERLQGYDELEVVHYPLSTAQDSAPDPADLPSAGDSSASQWTQPGPTANWDAALRDEMARDLAADGIDVTGASERSLVERVTPWLLRHAQPHGDFSTFHARWDGQRMIPLPGAPHAGDPEQLESLWQRDLFAAGMFRAQARGSCTSTAIYLNGCLRALDVPTRIVLCIPVVDPTDERELELVRRGLSYAPVRDAVLRGLEPLRRGWTSHTFNEVLLDGRWWRLDSHQLGRGILDGRQMGLLTHVATFADWADGGANGELVANWGRRSLGSRRDAFGGGNPYSAITLSDRWGMHAEPPAAEDAEPPVPAELTVDWLGWSNDPSAPSLVQKEDRLSALLRVGAQRDFPLHKRFTQLSDRTFLLEAPGYPTLSAEVGVGGCSGSGKSYALLRLSPRQLEQLAEDVAYTLRPRNGTPDHRWVVKAGLTLTRQARSGRER